jgi:hypothetical protein
VSREDLVRLYSERAISRRVFIRGLVGAGVSVTAAAAYARLLGAQNAYAAGPSGGPDLYDFYADFYSDFYPDFYGDRGDFYDFYDFYDDFYDDNHCGPRHRHRHRHHRHGRHGGGWGGRV